VTFISDLLISNAVRVIALGWATFLPILVFLRLLVFRLMGQLSDGPRDLATLTFDLGGHGAIVGDLGLLDPSMYQVLDLWATPVRRTT